MPLEASDLELLATSAYMLGRDDEDVAVLERVHERRLAAGETLPAARTAFWIGMQLIGGVGRDAKRVAAHIDGRAAARPDVARRSLARAA